MTPVRVLTVDDQPIFLEVARALLESTPGFDLVGEATSGVEALVAAERLHPDLVLLDVRMPGLDGLETARRLADQQPGAVVVLVSGDNAEDLRALAAESGAVALIQKERLRPRVLRDLWARHGPAAGAVRAKH
ncbi:MAG: response regulator transcription factor [Solirubrobacterales bacterium]|nr:response regulator transcription factor [Solirubrobacterales bacterium]